MIITISRGPNAGAALDFVREVKWLPGMGEKHAKEVYAGTAHTITIPESKRETALRVIRRLCVDCTIIAEGLPATETAEPQKEPAPMTTPVTTTADPRVNALLELFASGLTEARVLELIQQNGGRPAHVTIDLTAPGVNLSGDAVMHHKFPLLAAAVAARVNVMLVGPAGSGKTTAGHKIAQALGLKFEFTGALDTSYKLSGFVDAQGRIVHTGFRRAFEHGGVFLFDEMDASLPGALLAFNAALSNDMCDFPDKVIPRHPDFRAIAGANTYGTGADRQYVGRNQLDAASLDRYAVLDWGYDEALEASFIGLPAPKGSPVPQSIAPLPEVEVQGIATRWFERVRKVRHAVTDLKVRHVVSPRATINGTKLLAAGWSWADTEEAVIWKGLDADTKAKVAAKAA